MTFNRNEPQSSLRTQDCCLEVTSQHHLGPYGNNKLWLDLTSSLPLAFVVRVFLEMGPRLTVVPSAFL